MTNFKHASAILVRFNFHFFPSEGYDHPLKQMTARKKKPCSVKMALRLWHHFAKHHENTICCLNNLLIGSVLYHSVAISEATKYVLSSMHHRKLVRYVVFHITPNWVAETRSMQCVSLLNFLLDLCGVKSTFSTKLGSPPGNMKISLGGCKIEVLIGCTEKKAKGRSMFWTVGMAL